MKQVLSVADFAVILDLINKEICKFQEAGIPTWKEEERKRLKKERMEELEHNVYYQNLLHLKNSLENLNVEVETPDVKIEE